MEYYFYPDPETNITLLIVKVNRNEGILMEKQL